MSKSIISIFVLIMASAIWGVAQPDEERVKAIDTEVRQIERDSRLEKVSKQLDGVSRDAEGIYFKSSDGLRKMIARIYGNTGRSDNEYYYTDDKLIYAVQRWTKYDRSVEMGPVKSVKVVETKAYFFEDECLLLRVDGRTVERNSTEWKDELGSIVATTSIFRERM